MSSPQPNVSDAPARPEFSPRFWSLVALTGIGSGLAAGLLMKLLRVIQHAAFGYDEGNFLDGVDKVATMTRVLVPTGAGLLAAAVLYAIGRVKSGHSNELEATIWFRGGALDPPRTVIKGILSIVIVGLGASLGREAAPKQIGGLIGSLAAAWQDVPPTRRRLLAACGAGAGIAAVYNVPFGGALFALEVLLGTLALPLVAPAFATSLLAVATGWLLLPNEATYNVPSMHVTTALVVWAIVFGPIAGIASAGFVKLIAFVAGLRPKGIRIFPVSLVVFFGLGLLAIPYPQLLGNGKDVVELAALDRLAMPTLVVLMVLKPLATAACLGTGAPGGLFTPTLTIGALLGGVLGHLWLALWPEPQTGAFALVGAAAVLAATTKGPVSSLVLMMELTHRIDGLMVPMLIAIAGGVTVAHRIDVRSTYTSRVALPGSVRDCVVRAGLAAPDDEIAAVSGATRYADLLRLCLAREKAETIFVVDDGGEVVGTIARGDVVAPSERFMPLEIAAAADFVTGQAAAQDGRTTINSPESRHEAGVGPLETT